MRLLLVDDEKYTRDGIRKNIDFAALGIDDVVCCKNASGAIEAAKSQTPDILLTDIRMPHMTGIDLAKEILVLNPECKIIFMSGYSDKEYLLAAVKLKAVNYVEKPISLEELSNTVRLAAEEIRQSIKMDLLSRKANEAITEAIPGLKSEAALMLTRPKLRTERLKSLLDMTHIGNIYSGIDEVVIFRVYSDDYILNEEFDDILSNAAEKYRLKFIFGKKNDEIYVIHLFFKDIHDKSRGNIKRFIREVFDEAGTDIYASAGTPEKIENAYKSYQNAFCALSAGFYTGYNTISTLNSLNGVYKFDDKVFTDFKELIIQRNRDGAVRLIRRTAAEIKENKATLVSVTKNYFYMLGSEVLKLSRDYELGKELEISRCLDNIHLSGTLDELIFSMVKIIDILFDNLNTEYENNIVWKIKQYIKENYRDQQLSLSEISDFLNLNISYISIVFKEEAGTSINRYITSYRISKAKELLLKHDLRIKDIACMVGFQNANYFAKVFKKAEGIQPKEYRTKNMI